MGWNLPSCNSQIALLRRSALSLALGFAWHCSFAPSLCAQSLMVGADGAVHLDEMQEQVQANDPVIIEQQPELVQPGFGDPGQFTGMSAPSMPDPNSMAVALQQPYGACGACSVPFVPCTPCVPCIQPPPPIMFSFFGEFLFLHPTGVDMVHAQQQNGIGGAGTVPFGGLAVNDFHYEPAVRIGGDMAVSCTTSIAATVTWFESNASSRLEAPTIPGGGGAVGSLVHHPGTALTAAIGPVDGRSVLNFQLAEAQYRVRLLQGPRFWVNGGLGVEFGRLEQEFGQVGVFGGGQGGAVSTQSNIEFDGGGVKFAIDGGRNIGNRGFSVYGRAGLAPLVGQYNSDYTMQNDTTTQQLAHVHWNDDRFTPVLDYEAGLAWTGPRRRWRFAAGYTVAYWFNAVTPGSFINAVQANNYTDVSDTISFDGLTAHVEHLW